LSNFDTRGGVASFGRSLRMVATRSRTSWAAVSMSLFRLKVTIVDPLDGVDHFLDPLGELAFHLFRGGAGELGPDRDGGQVDRGEPVDAEAEVAGPADDHQRQDEHRREDRAADADFGELLQERATGSR
jgi:hypothetical protein